MTICTCLMHTDNDCASDEGCCPLEHGHCICANGCQAGRILLEESERGWAPGTQAR